MRLAIVGVTGMVGQEMLRVLEASNFPISRLFPVASESSKGKTIEFNGEKIPIITVAEALLEDVDIALFSAGGEFSLEFAPKFAAKGIRVIDNSSAWRMHENIKLIIPEVNGGALSEKDMIIANPNCSTIQLVMALWPLHKEFILKRVVVSTYQSITGTGKKAVEQMQAERSGLISEKVYPHQIDLNCLPHCDSFTENAYTKEEMKLVNESRKIMELPKLRLTATAVRVPVVGGHSESVNVSFEKKVDVDRVKSILSATPGVVVQDDVENNIYPMPVTSKGKDEVFVGRIRMDESEENSLNMWIVSDNLRKGAATNTVQIARLLIGKHILT
ncbi:MAG: aspartate-semialdehyde dehydrogenase [Vicingaceae bacterium]